MAEALATLLRLRRAEREARGLARQWQATFDALGDGVALLDPRGVVLRCNAALARLLGRPAGEVAGRPLDDPALRGAVPVDEMRRAGRRAAREVALGGRWFRATADPLPGEEGAAAGA